MKYQDLLEPPFLIGVAGGTASGKSTVCEKIIQLLGPDYEHDVSVVSQESFYREFTESEKQAALRGEFNFDHPRALDDELMLSTLKKLKAGETVKIPRYDYRTHSKMLDNPIVIKPAKVVLVEGILVFYNENIRELFCMKLFVDSDPDTRLARRVMRDVKERERTLEQTLHQYLTCVKPAYEEFCLPTKKYADIIIPRGVENEVALSVIVQHVTELLKTRGRLDQFLTAPLSPPPAASRVSPRNRHQSDSVYRPH